MTTPTKPNDTPETAPPTPTLRTTEAKTSAAGGVTLIPYDPYAATPPPKPLPVDKSITLIPYTP